MILTTNNGWVILDKPVGISSNKALVQVKRAFGVKKAGHAGTLDPLASGVLPIALGEATKTVSYVMADKKSYQFTICWGESRDTDDCEGEIVETSPHRPSETEILAVIPQFIGKIQQMPPIFSALKVNGQRAYALARKGEKVELKARDIDIYDLKLLKLIDDNHASFVVSCGKGTYVRSLARDIAVALGTKGHISDLRRLSVGSFNVSNAISLDSICNLRHGASWKDLLLPVESVLDDILAISLTAEEANDLRCGKEVILDQSRKSYLNGQVKAVAKVDNKLLAIVSVMGDSIKPVRVFNL